MKTRRDWYHALAVVAFIFVVGFAALGFSVNGIEGALDAAPGLLLVAIPALLAWRCDVRLREERRHEALMKALLAIHKRMGGG